MKIAVYGQVYENESSDYIRLLLKECKSKNVEVFIEEELYQKLRESGTTGNYNTFTKNSGLDRSFKMFVSFGGDGTILRAVTYIRNLDIPIVGVNTGRLGFLSTLKKEEVKRVLNDFVDGKYRIEERSLVEVQADFEIPEFKEYNFALNEVSISRKDTTSMITVETYLNEEYLTSYWADGLIIATPTGSTGYSLSCGGPVINPDVKSLVITPIAPHNLNARPLVISDDTVLRMKVYGREEQHLVSLDSRIASLDNEKEITVKKANFTVKMIAYNSESFLDTLRNKLLWGQDKRN